MPPAAPEVHSQLDSTKTQVKDGGHKPSAAQNEVHAARQTGNHTADDTQKAQSRADAEKVFGKVEIHDSGKQSATEQTQPTEQSKPNQQAKAEDQSKTNEQAKPQDQAKAQDGQKQESISDWWHRTVNNVESKANNAEHTVEAKAASAVHTVGQELHNAGTVDLAIAKGTLHAAEQTGMKIVHGAEKVGTWAYEHPKTAIAAVAVVAAAG